MAFRACTLKCRTLAGGAATARTNPISSCQLCHHRAHEPNQLLSLCYLSKLSTPRRILGAETRTLQWRSG
eukprot:1189641-Prorocentrum_minimum.AAC.1